MIHPMQELLRERLSSGLARKSIKKCSAWAERYRVLGGSFPGPWRFPRYPWLKDMHDSDAEMNIGQKSAQMGYTETVLNRTIFNVDVNGMDCLYVLPSWKPDASDFSAARFNPAIEMSPHLQSLFSDVSNVGHKRAGLTNLYIRGSHSRSQLKSIPVGSVVVDEKDEMDQASIPLVFERQSGQVRREAWQISTPTYPEYGINKDFINSSQNHFYFACPYCHRFTHLVFPECLVVTAEKITDQSLKESHLICKECKHKLDHETKEQWLADGRWVEHFDQRDVKGWYINQLYSPTVQPWKVAESVLKAEQDPAEEQELYNSKLGLPHVLSGTGVTDEDLAECTSGYRLKTSYEGSRIITMGVDVGFPLIHVEIDEWMLPPIGTPIVDINTNSRPRIIGIIEALDFDELDKLMQDFRVHFCVIDAQPERRKALEFANRFYGKVRLCSYEQGITGKAIHEDNTEPRVKVDRTSWLDLSLGRFKKRTIGIPGNTPYTYKVHIKNQVRRYDKDKQGNQVGRYITPSGEDHFGHARNYAEIALPLAASINVSHNITKSIY